MRREACREAALHALADEREEREATHLLLQDVYHDNSRLRARNRALEQGLATLLDEREERFVAAGGNGAAAEAATAAAAEQGLNMANVKTAIEAAVAEAASMPEEERKKKIRALRLKWHPDKHDVLKEMASEVTKIINEAVERHEA